MLSAETYDGHCHTFRGLLLGTHKFAGEYDFSDEKLQDSVGILPPKLAA